MSTRPVAGQKSGTEPSAAITRPADLKSWIGTLPYANREAALRTLTNALSALNAATVKPSVRFELLELHAGAYVRLLNAVVMQQSNGDVTVTKQHRAFAEMARTLTLSLVDGYRLVVNGTASKRASLFGNRRSDASAIQRAILFSCYSLNHYYDQYLPTEPRVWIELAKLYGLALERGITERSVSRNGHRQEFGKHILHLYKRALLTALADPYRHGPGEVWKMFEFLGECADAAQLSVDPPSAGPEGIFVIDPRGVDRAFPLAFVADARAVKGYYLDTNSTVQVLEKMRDEVEQGRRENFSTARSKQQAVAIMNRIVRSLKEPAKRADDRTPIEAPVELAVGISATHHLIGGALGGVAQATFSAGAEVATHGREPKGDQGAVIKMIDPRSGGTVDVSVNSDDRRKGVDGKQTAGADGASVKAIYGSDLWNVTNKSRRGIGITRTDRPKTPLCTGEIVSIVKKKRASIMGLVRWFTVDEAGIHRAGVEIIGKRAESVLLRSAEQESKPGAARPALAMPFFGADEKVATLVALPGTFREGGVLVVQSSDGDAQVRVRMNSLIDATPSCERFTYRVTRGNS